MAVVAASLTTISLAASEAGAAGPPVPLALYEFTEGGGTTVGDSGSGPPLDLNIADPSAVTWLPGGGLRVNSPTALSSGAPATKVIAGAKASGALTLEAWVEAANTTQDGPARIVSISATTTSRNVTLGQGQFGSLPADTYDARVRTSATSTNGQPSLSSPAGTASTALSHVAYTRTATGAVTLYVNGSVVASGGRSGTLGVWDNSMALVLANEATGGRPWLGTYCRIALYDVALEPAEVAANHAGGCRSAPNAAPVADPIAERSDAEGASVSLAATATDADGDTLTWSATGLPAGLGVNATTGVISGTISQTAATGSPYAASVTVNDGRGGSDSAAFTWTVTPVAEPGPPVPLALYEFTEGGGTTVGDSGSGPPLDLNIADPSAVTWLPGGGLRVNSPTALSSGAPATKVIAGAKASGALTLEAWVEAANTTQDGPARIVSISATTTSRNVTLGQGQFGSLPADTYDARVRTSATSTNGQPSLSSPAGTASTALSHVAYTRTATGAVTLYVNGSVVASGGRSGTLGVWDNSMALVLANEATGGRPWLGTYCRIALYDVALEPAEVAANHAGGCRSAPNAAPVADPIAERSDAEGASVSLAATATDADGDTLTWSATGLPAGLGVNATTGVISGTISQTAATGSPYAASVTVNDGRGGSDSAAFTWSVTAVNVAPNVDAIGNQLSGEGSSPSVGATATDADGDTLAWSAAGLPTGLGIDGATGVISGTIAEGAAGASPYSVTITATDPAGADGTTTFVWTVSEAGAWWSATHAYRLSIAVSAGDTALRDRVANVDVDFGAALGGSALDAESLRVVEIDAAAAVIDPAVPFQFDPGPGYDPATNPQGSLAILLPGDTPAGVTRSFHIYFDDTGGSTHLPPPVATLVGPAEIVDDEGQASYRIATPAGTWLYQRQGAAFSSLEDTNGNDWIGYGSAAGSAGQFRGIPNLVNPEGYFHPGSSAAASTVVRSGPVATSIESTTADGWAIRWDIFPTHATATVLAAPRNYWFLYEGTPGGQLDPATDTVTRSGDVTTPLGQSWTGDLPGPEWAYFTDPGLGRSLYLVAHEDDPAVDSYRPMDSAMTVFGFGRDGLTSGLTGAPRSFSVGLVDTAGADVALQSAQAPLGFVVGAAEARAVSATAPFPAITMDANLGEATFTLVADGNGSTDPDGEVVGYEWDFGDGATATGASVSHAYLSPGRYALTLRVTDDAGLEASDHAGVVVVPDVAEPPVAVATATPSRGLAPLDATLDGSASFDPDGSVTGWSWDLGDGSVAAGPTVVHTYTAPGLYVVRLTVVDNEGLVGTTTVNVRATDPSVTRVNGGLVALYEFGEGSGETVRDTSGAGAPLDLVIGDASQTSWVPDGLRLDRRTAVASPGPATKIRNAVTASNEVTLEAWVLPDNLEQNGPARIATISGGTLTRNLTLGQGVYGSSSDRIETRLRTTSTNANGQPATATPSASLSTELTHVVFSRAAGGATAIWIDGALAATGTAGGSLSNWGDFRLALGDEIGGSRPWLGTYFLVALYDRALTAEEVGQNYAAAPNGDGTYPNLAPTVVLTIDPLVGSAPLAVNLDASGSTDPDGTIVSFEWDLGDGSTASGPTVSHVYPEPGAYPITVTITDDEGTTVAATETVLVLSDDVSGAVSWTRLSSDAGDLDPPGSQPHQTVAVVGDISGDGVNDFVIGSRFGTVGPSVVWYERNAAGWTKRTIEPDLLNLEAGGALHDIDGDGDLDLVIGEDSTGRRIWWWENPAPAFDGTPWTRRIVKDGGDLQHHDQAFGDVDGDGRAELVYWNNRGSHRLLVAEIPLDPTVEPWPASVIFTAAEQSEGIAIADIDGDGVDDIVGGGYWFRHVGGGAYETNVIDATMGFTRAGVGDLVEGGRPEVVFDSGDVVGDLRLYEWTGAGWTGRTILPGGSAFGHSLNLGDINLDGHLDILSAEMKFPDFLHPAMRVLYGDGAGGFVVDELARGIGNHESKLADLDGDGDLDILGKPFRQDVPGLNIWLNDGPSQLAVDQWTRFVADASVPWRTVFVEHGDIDGDGLDDVIAGGWWWRNPGTISGTWVRSTIGSPLNQMAAVFDFDRDGDLDILGTEGVGSESNDVFRWAQNDGLGSFTIHANVAVADGTFLQGVTVAELVPGRFEVALSWQNGSSGLQTLTVPDPADITTATWTWRLASSQVSGEGLDSGDIDGDGDIDLVDGVSWFRNDGSGALTRIVFNFPASGEPDRTVLADMDGDGDLDAVIGYGHDPDGKVAWYEQGVDPTAPWTEHLVATLGFPQAQSLDVADLDGDGDFDLVVGEHTNPDAGGNRALVYENVGDGFSVVHVIYAGDEHHDGMQLVDFDGDGDLDVVSIGWTHRRLLLYENLALG